MQDTLKPRPLRLTEFLWDLVPVAGSVLFYAFVLSPQFSKFSFPLIAEFLLSALLPITATMWMLFSCGDLLARFSRREFREQLALTGTEAREFLVSVFRYRLISQRLPFILSGVALISFLSIGSTSAEPEPITPAEWFFVSAFLVGFISLQISGYSLGVWALMTRLRRLCGSSESDTTLLTSLHFLGILIVVPSLIFAGLMTISFMADSDLSEDQEMYYMGLYLHSASLLAGWFFVRAKQRSWRLTAEAFFKFE